MSKPKKPQESDVGPYAPPTYQSEYPNAARDAAVDSVLSKIDWNNAPFPSNRRTFQQIRSHFITVAKIHSVDELQMALNDLGDQERGLVVQGIERGLGHDQDTSPEQREAIRLGLAYDYQEAGIAGGPHEAIQLVEQLENWAAMEARKHTPAQSR